MPITSTTNALATITSVTNTLPTITNGTNIYLQQQITTTDLSTVSISNLITETTAITSWSDPALWSALAAILSVGIITYQAILSRSSIKHMESQNKISADSVNEMKRQYEQKEEKDQRREEEKYLREYIDKNLTPRTEVMFQNQEDIVGEMKLGDIKLFNYTSFRHFVQLANNSEGLFYQKNITSIFNKISKYTGIANDPKDIHSSTVKKMYSLFFVTISDSLYSALTNEDSYKSLMGQIDNRINDLEKVLTQEKEKQNNTKS